LTINLIMSYLRTGVAGDKLELSNCRPYGG
jgi:hypothetical protein